MQYNIKDVENKGKVTLFGKKYNFGHEKDSISMIHGRVPSQSRRKTLKHPKRIFRMSSKVRFG